MSTTRTCASRTTITGTCAAPYRRSSGDRTIAWCRPSWRRTTAASARWRRSWWSRARLAPSRSEAFRLSRANSRGASLKSQRTPRIWHMNVPGVRGTRLASSRDGGGPMVAIHRILCPVDLSPCSRTALEYALALARWYEAELSVLHVFRQVPVVDTAAAALGGGLYAPTVVMTDVDRADIDRRVAAFVAATPGAQGVSVRTCEGVNVREEIVRHAGDVDADLL